MYLNSLLNCGFKGKIYPINPKAGEIFGLKVYANIKNIPEPVDYVICCTPVSFATQLMRDCIAKKVKVVHFFTSGFGETGTEEGKQLEQEISSLARRNGIRIIGPNCMGIYCPETGLSFAPDFVKESGSVALICQSGGNSMHLVREGVRRGIKFSKVISYGNACDIDECDLLEYLAADQDTELIAAYIEGVKDGKRFSQLLKEVARVKPVIVLKGGVGEAGARAAASHTGVLAGSNEVWDGLLHQAGAIRVHSLEELVDMAVTFAYFPLPLSKRTAVLGVGGGATVLATDDCTNAGLEVPRPPPEVQSKLKSYVKRAGVGLSLINPVDLSAQGREPDVFYNCSKVLLEHEGIDLLLIQLPFDIPIIPSSTAKTHGLMLPTKEAGWDIIIKSIIKIHKESDKPIAVVIHSITYSESYQDMLNYERMCYEAGLPVYHSLTNASKAIVRFIDYHKRRARMQGLI